ncbi:MAG: Hint domain-containing protein [Gemmobacter sp.]
MIVLYLRGDQIATYQTLQSSGNANGTQVTLGGVQPLGSATQYFRVVITQVGPGQSSFLNGQQVAIHSWPDNQLITSGLNPQHDQFQGRASSGGHQIFTNQNYLFQVDPITPGTVQYGPGAAPPRNQQLSFSSFPDTPPPVPCFEAGTRIRSWRGAIPAADLRPGDLVWTLDHGYRPVLWIGRRTVTPAEPQRAVMFAAGLFGNRRPLVVSPQHRILLRGPAVELATGFPEALAAAIHLVGAPGIMELAPRRIDYVHLLLHRHEILSADGLLAESLWPVGPASSGFGPEAEVAIRASLGAAGATDRLRLARPCLTAREAAVAIRDLLAGRALRPV